MSGDAERKRAAVLDEYYRCVYAPLLFGGGAQGMGISLFEKAVERYWDNPHPARILEVGSGSGEHLGFVAATTWDLYIALDLAPNRAPSAPKADAISDSVKVVQGDAQDLPFSDGAFDRVVSTCLLHHVVDPLAVLMEVRRVMQPGGEFAVVLPTDPGLLNRFVKLVATYPKIRKLSSLDPRLVYALEHRNHVGALQSLIKFVFADDTLKFHYSPFLLPSWNANLWVVAHAIRR